MTPAAKYLISVIPLIVSYYVREYQIEDQRAFEADVNAKNVFDFIVVGGGTAGCVVARRLADEKFKVLLLEAGGTPPPQIKIPLATPDYAMTFDPDLTYWYKSTKQKYLGLDNNGILHSHASKMLGGGSSHNGMYYQRGSPFDYDLWANITGDDSWSYSKILQYFRKFENYQGNFSSVRNELHGTDGPVTITSPNFREREVWYEAGKELGFEFIDANGHQRVGFAPNEAFIDTKGWRVTSYSAYIESVEESLKDYLTIRRYSPVHRILFKDKKAVGVSYQRHGKPAVAWATKEIILSAGAIMSPLLLIKSGIGPEEELVKVKAKPVQVLPQVGNNLQDHVVTVIKPFVFTKQPQTLWSIRRNLSYDDVDDVSYRGKGPVGGAADAIAFLTSSLGKAANPEWPDLIVRYRYQGLDENICIPILGLPRSSGRVRLNESATGIMDDNLPLLDYRYLTEPSDSDVILEGIDFCFKAYEQTAAFQKLGAKFTGSPIESCKHLTFRSRKYWRCYVQHTSFQNWHSSGTLRLGRKGDLQGSAVDPELSVHGVESLRVIDASIFPKITNANTAGPTFAIAEKGADMIIHKHLKHKR